MPGNAAGPVNFFVLPHRLMHLMEWCYQDNTHTG